MLQFAKTIQEYPQKRSVEKRQQDFKEIYEEYKASKAKTQASRCSQCGVPFCQIHCPLNNNIPDWLKLAAEGFLQEAYILSTQTNMMPEICGRICPQDRLCEGGCVVEQSQHGAVTIGSIEKFITETAWENNWVLDIKPRIEHSQTVGIIGAGPAGLTLAEILRQNGYGVTIYDRYDRAGGLLMYGIPDFKLEKSVVIRRIERLKKSGVIFQYKCSVGKTILFDDLRQKHDALFIATGVYKAKDLKIPGLSQNHYVAALEFLTVSNKHNLGDAVQDMQEGERLNVKGKNVIVIGGGDTAMDCVRTAVRRGALSVTCLYRRDRNNMPGSAREVQNAIEEGVNFEWLGLPKGVIAHDNGLPKSLIVSRMKLNAKDISGRASFEEIPDKTFTLPCDMVIGALGFDPEDIPHLFQCIDLKLTHKGTLDVNPQTNETSVEGVFAGGDIVRGASLVVWAVKDGRDVAPHIITYLKQKRNVKKIT